MATDIAVDQLLRLGNEFCRADFVSAAQAQAKEEDMLDLQLRERNAQRNLQALERDIQALAAQAQVDATTAQSTLAELDSALAQLSQESTEQSLRSGLTLNSPKAGVITVLTVSHAGQSVQAGQSLLAIAPQNQGGTQPLLEAQLFGSSRAIGFVKPGQTVWLRMAAYPYQKFGMTEGVVTAVSRSPVSSQDLPAGQAQALLMQARVQESLFRVTVHSIDGRGDFSEKFARPLKAGMTFDADIAQERRKVWEWLLDPLLAITRGKR